MKIKPRAGLCITRLYNVHTVLRADAQAAADDAAAAIFTGQTHVHASQLKLMLARSLTMGRSYRARLVTVTCPCRRKCRDKLLFVSWGVPCG